MHKDLFAFIDEAAAQSNEGLRKIKGRPRWVTKPDSRIRCNHFHADGQQAPPAPDYVIDRSRPRPANLWWPVGWAVGFCLGAALMIVTLVLGIW